AIAATPTAALPDVPPAASCRTSGGVTAADSQTWTGASTNKTLTSLGSYKVAEDPHPGYDATFSPDCETTIALGDTKTCTVTNTAQAAQPSSTTTQDNNTKRTIALLRPSSTGTISGQVRPTDGTASTEAWTNKT